LGNLPIIDLTISGRLEEIYLPEDGPTELGANVSIADAE